MTWDDAEEIERLIEKIENNSIKPEEITKAVLILLKTAKREFYDCMES